MATCRRVDAVDETGRILKDGQVVGLLVDGQAKVGFGTPSRKLEFYQPTMAEWGWTEPEYTLPHGRQRAMFTRIISTAPKGRCSCCRTSACRR